MTVNYKYYALFCDELAKVALLVENRKWHQIS